MLLNLKHHKAFSLAELAITLSLIGILAVSLLPMISNSQAGPRKYTATLKTTLTTIENAVATELLRGDNFNSYRLIQQNLKPERSCPGNSSTQGCWNNAVQGSSVGETGEPGFILKNGVSLVGLNTFGNATSGNNGWLIDANGIDGPNQLNVDQLFLSMCSGAANTCIDPSGGGHKVATGVFIPGGGGATAARFDEIME
jgi:prepilin-type N-terminal cleavage/methylation domain-containing protein